MLHHDYTHIDTVCPECKSHQILRDNLRNETYCTQCGLILMDNTLPSLLKEIRATEKEFRFIRDLWRK